MSDAQQSGERVERFVADMARAGVPELEALKRYHKMVGEEIEHRVPMALPTYEAVLERQQEFANEVGSDQWGRDMGGKPQRYPPMVTERWHDLIANGEPYYWAPDMCQLLSTVAASVPRSVLYPDMLPTTSGFAFFTTPISVGLSSHLHAYSWGLAEEDGEIYGIRALDVGVVTPFSSNAVFPGLELYWRFGDDWPEVVALKLPGEPMVSELHPNFPSCVLVAMLLLLKEPILRQTVRETGDRASRRRLERKGYTVAPLRIVQMRRVLNEQTDTSGHRDVDWKHSWVVRSHWRQQPCGPGGKGRRTRLIAPYLKGDPDKPLLGGERLFAVIR